jgi:uncharacterized protein (TIGR02246 family)
MVTADAVIFDRVGANIRGKRMFEEGEANCMEGKSEIRELRVLGDWAYLRNHIAVTMAPSGGEPVRRSGFTLTILRKDPDGRWRLFRDANLLAPEPASG